MLEMCDVFLKECLKYNIVIYDKLEINIINIEYPKHLLKNVTKFQKHGFNNETNVNQLILVRCINLLNLLDYIFSIEEAHIVGHFITCWFTRILKAL
jgi:hypothetical protein